MASFVVRRVLATLAVLFFASLIAFVLLRAAPGDPARKLLGPQASEQAVSALRADMGVDRPLLQQYGTYVGDLATGDLGYSWRTRTTVTAELTARLPATLELAMTAMAIALLLAIPIGVLSAGRRRWVDRFSRAGAIVGLGMPQFWLGLVLILVFFTWLGIAPAPFGRIDDTVAMPARTTGLLLVDSLIAGDFAAFGNALSHLVLPALTLAIPLAAYLSRIVRRSTIDVYRNDYVRTARAKGASETRVLFRHALPNALLPILTLSGMWFGELMAGALLVEAVFNWPGIGGWVAQSIQAQDYAPVQGAILLGALVYSVVNLVTDLLYGVVDPRIRLATT
ncbi:ABC transporter permease [Conexibacter sp. JD483]|uniref:ABC transporter permease n=1 Tax=unclassified Conexibacter TaxID=2627773 RepID=UPI00271BEEB2|nr:MULTISPECIES: ABC transporter permease [unclassified Conexibacter]MDO8187647.1 ABC transporter permease [Conexibacter sp. CPCC 205706]MDO8199832.1 ABC transporter permease [Conexibacter sp. CPCC 205762]MDR9370209.1 ABC transporter permease [Conexibacter sp. JD483]